MASSLLIRRQRSFQTNPSLTRFFSNSSSSSDPPPQTAEKPSQSPPSSHSPPSYSSPFADIKSTLKQKLHQDQEGKPFARSSDAQDPPFTDHKPRSSLHDIGTKLAKFRRRSTTAPPPIDSSQPRPRISFEALYKQNVVADPRNRKGDREGIDSSSLWENLKTLKAKSNALGDTEMKGVSFRSFKSTLKGNAGRGGEAFPASVFGNERKKGREGETEEMMTEFLKIYREDELGEKLRRLRPEGKKEEGWFSLQELNERLVKLREVEEKEVYGQRGNVSVIRNVIGTFRNEEAINEAISQQNHDILGYLDGTPEYKLYPPKDDLVDTYFHTDNLSSAEKMKIELTKVREDFKMSESDCGSARVQVAQLTTKIKHLSSALHKKDKHSRKGLFAMVQKRKKLLKYLRRTDWDSYCLVLSKLSLRDNPDYKF